MQTKQFELGTQTVKIETGLIAKQANASVTVEIDGTVILSPLFNIIDSLFLKFIAILALALSSEDLSSTGII